MLFTTCKPLILASASPRRKKFLEDLGIAFSCHPADIDETARPEEPPPLFALRMAETKARIIAEQYPQAYVIGADTIVTQNNQILGKPTDEAHALQTLRSLQGKTHQVITGLALFCLQENCTQSLTRTTDVTFGSFSNAILLAYIKTGEPMDKAGAYGIQGTGSFLVKTIKGSCSNVIGLPINDCTAFLLNTGVITPVNHTKR